MMTLPRAKGYRGFPSAKLYENQAARRTITPVIAKSYTQEEKGEVSRKGAKSQRKAGEKEANRKEHREHRVVAAVRKPPLRADRDGGQETAATVRRTSLVGRKAVIRLVAE
jgi:hypothetical protein